MGYLVYAGDKAGWLHSFLLHLPSPSLARIA